MRGAFHVATAFFIASSTRTAAESDQIKSVITQNHDKLPAGGSDTKTLPRRSLKGSGDHLETLVAEEERVRLAEVLKAKKIVPKLLSRLEEAQMKLENYLREMFPVGEHVGTSATPSREGSQILRKNLEDAIVKLEQVNMKIVGAKKILTALERMKAEALKVKKGSNELHLFERADHAANEAVSHLKNIDKYESEMNKAAEKAITVKIEEIIFLTVVDEIKQLENNQNPKKIQDLEADLQKKVDKAIKKTESNEETYRGVAERYWQFLDDVIKKEEELYRKSAEIYKSSASEASSWYNLYRRKVKRAKKVGRFVRAKQDARIKKVNHLVQEPMAAQDGERPQLSSNFGAVLPEKSTYASQDLIAAHATPMIHLDTDSHVIPAPEELDLTSSLPNLPNVRMKFERKRQSDHLDDNREGGVQNRQRTDADPQGL